MDYIWIGIRAFTYVIIFTLIKIIVPKLLGNVKYKKDEMGRTYFSKKKISYFLFVIAVFFTVLLSFLSTIPSNVSGDAKIYLNVGIVIFCLLWYILSIMFDVWYIHLEPTQIIYRNYLGAKKVIKASDIYYFERNSNGSLIIVCSDETKVSFEPEYADSIMLWMSEQSIKTKNARKKDRFFLLFCFWEYLHIM